VIFSRMKASIKTSLIIIALALVACLVGFVWLVSRPDELDQSVSLSVSEASPGPSFDVRVVVPRLGLPFAGILPDWVVKKFDLTPSELRFDHKSGGAKLGSGPNSVELSADGWKLFIETDGEGRVTPETRFLFPLALGGRHVRLNCRPADRAAGHLRTTTRAGSDELGGSFVVELATCTNSETGKDIEWPPAPLTLRGSFVGRPTRSSPEPHGDQPKAEVNSSPSS
jgi:hypothetical protein